MNRPDDITDILKDRDRILVAAWMLPSEGALSDAQRKQAMANFAQYARRAGIAYTEVARQVDAIAATHIDALVNGRFDGDCDAKIRKLNWWVEQHARGQAVQLSDTFVTTSVAKSMEVAARLARENRTMALVFGPTGIGKTRCAEALRDKYVGSILIRVIDGRHSPKGLTRAIADDLGIRYATVQMHQRTFGTLLERVIAALRDTGRLLMIDEAAKLTDSAIELLRDIHDAAGIPILLIAVRDLHDRIAKKADADAGQLYSRFDIVHHLTEDRDVHTGGRKLFTVEEIRELYDEPPIRLAPDAVRYLQDVANKLGFGSLRRCRILLLNSARRARKRQNLADHDDVTVSASDLAWVEANLRTGQDQQGSIEKRSRQAAHAASA